MMIRLREKEMGIMGQQKHLSIRMDPEVHDKIQYIAAYDGRSLSVEIKYLILSRIREFEKENGVITEADMHA